MGRYAIKTPQQNAKWEDMLAVWREADTIDLFESAWNFDHFNPIHGDPNGPCMEAWVTLTALAQATSRIRIGCMVNGMHFRHPAITAKMAASLDIVSGGRLYLGLGAGWQEQEASSYGIDLGTMTERMDRFDEGVEVIVRLLTQETTTFEGEHYRLTGARCEPKPVQRPHIPIAIGGSGEKRTLRTVAEWAHWWDGLLLNPDEWKRKHEVLVDHCEAVDRDPAEITCSAHVAYSRGDDPEAIADQAEERFQAGVDVVVFSMRSPYDVSMIEPLAAALATRVAAPH
ncbi:MAG TPA: LLM class F420-dependent oxidoreductase [Acidimicrobiia bacterium]|jgi:F420-dependent oxidoreductase-like protein|nr:LLM class F420-dependent oxidoreductase [Acidimicrobiia bacterium]